MKKQTQKIIKLGSETETENSIYHLLGHKKSGYEVWQQPFIQWNGKKIRSYTNWHKVKTSKKLGECRKAIKNAISQPINKENKVHAEIKRQNRSSAKMAAVAKKCPAKAAAKKPMRTVRKPMTAKKTSTPVKKK